MKTPFIIISAITLLAGVVLARELISVEGNTQPIPAKSEPSDTSIFWGPPTNSIRIGVKILPESNQLTKGSRIWVYMQNVSATSMPATWIAPDGFQRCNIGFSDGMAIRAIEQIATTRSTNQIFTSLREVPKNGRGFSIGWLSLAPDASRPFLEIVVTTCKKYDSNILISVTNGWPVISPISASFQISTNSENCSLSIVGQALRVNPSDQSLTQVEFLPVVVPIRFRPSL